MNKLRWVEILSSWQSFFATVAGVFAALTGLVFVALSINLKEILSIEGLSGRAGEAILLLLYPVFVGIIGIAPQSNIHSLGWQIGIPTALLLAFIVKIIQSAIKLGKGRPIYEIGTRITLAVLPTFAGLIASVMLITGMRGGFWTLLITVILCAISGVSDAWVLLVEILR